MMKKVLIATSNKDKFSTVSNIFRHTIFPESEYEIICQNEEKMIPDIKEQGNNIQRAKDKALCAFDFLKDYHFDYIVGLDDALDIKGRIEPNVKEYIHKILYEDYLKDGEQFGFNRAYCIIDKNKKIYEIALSIPQIYHPLQKSISVEKNTYPLSNVSYPIGYDKPVNELDQEEVLKYNLKYVKDGLISLNIK